METLERPDDLGRDGPGMRRRDGEPAFGDDARQALSPRRQRHAAPLRGDGGNHDREEKQMRRRHLPDTVES